jgi:hypothetical protein
VAIDYSTALGQVRLLSSDVNEADFALDDDMVAGYLARYGLMPTDPPTGNRAPINRAAADMIDAIATSEALIGKVISTVDGLKTDAAKLADSLRKHAATLRKAADDDSNTEEGGTVAYFGAAGGFPSHPLRKEAEEYQVWGLY